MLCSRFVRTAAGLAGALCCSLGLAQNTLEHPVGDVVPLVYKSGMRPNAAPVAKVMDTQVIQMPQSGWMRLYFDSVALDEGSFLRITSMGDGEVQILDSAAVAMWSNSTAYFNGDTISIELIAGPMTDKNFFEVGRLGRQMPVPEGDPGQCGICGADDRTLSGELWSGRIMPVGCTGSVYCTGNGMITAGHCVDGQTNLVMHFNVPASTTGCATVAPPVNDQFPVLPGWVFVNGGIGNDYSAYQVGTNGLGQTPFARYGQMRAIAAAPAANGAVSRIWGYGLDTNCVRSQVQQFSPGNVSAVAATNYQFSNDIRGGNSGSGFLNANNEIIGVVTHCSFAGCPGYATRVDLPAFVTARNTVGCAAPAPPANDNCGNATFIGLGSVSGTTVNATNDGNASCGSSTTSPDVWYYFRPNCNGTYRFHTCDAGTSYDTVLSVHTGCPGTAANQVTATSCNDDAGSLCTLNGLRSQLDVALTAGTFYWIRVSGFNNASGTFVLNVSAVTTDPAPGNDACAAATGIGLGSINGSNLCAGTDGGTTCGFQATNDVWYSFTAPCTKSYTFSTCGGATNFDTVLSLHSACPGTTANQIACNDDTGGSCGLGSTITANLTAGTNYRIRVSGYFNAVGTFTLTTTEGVGPQANDLCANAIAIAVGGSASGSTVCANNDGSANCAASAASPDVWYSFTADCSGWYVADCQGSNYDTALSIHSGCPGNVSNQVACNDDFYGLISRVVWYQPAGTTYLIRMNGFANRTGNYVLNVGNLPNNDCNNFVFLPGNGSFGYSNRGATTDGTTAGICLDVQNNTNVNQDVWFLYQASCTGTVTANTCDSTGYDSKMAAYAYQACPPVNPLACNDDAGGACPVNGLRSQVIFPVTQGNYYIIRIGGYSTATGCGFLNVSCTAAGCWGTCVSDFDDGSGTGTPDGGTTIDDLLYYLAIFEAGDICADVDDGSGTNTLDGGVTIDDLLYYLVRFELGC